jgi:hypothetical protein
MYGLITVSTFVGVGKAARDASPTLAAVVAESTASVAFWSRTELGDALLDWAGFSEEAGGAAWAGGEVWAGGAAWAGGAVVG